MKALRLTLIALLFVTAGGAAWWFWPRANAGPESFQGYIEGNLVYIAAEEGGRIETIAPVEGDRVGAGQVVATLDAAMQIAQRNEAAAKLAQARSTLANIKAALQRPEQVAVLQAQEDRARAALDYSTREYDRQKNLAARGFATTTALDQAKSAFDRDTAALAEAKRQIEAAQLGGRSGEIEAAEAAINAAAASLVQAETRLAKRRLQAPAPATVQDIFFRQGEVVNPGQPMLSLLPPGNLRVRFYVPEPRLSRLSLGDTVEVSCDGCGENILAKLSFISEQAEYTPPVIFSTEERAKLVFRVEARISSGRTLPIGLPVGVRPQFKMMEAAP